MTGDKRKLILVDDPLCKQLACQYHTSIVQHTIMNSKKSISKSKNTTTHPSLKLRIPHHLHHHSASASESEESVAIIHHTKETSSSTICW